jgi:tetratricopeptide (TPR) repeat protein
VRSSLKLLFVPHGKSFSPGSSSFLSLAAKELIHCFCKSAVYYLQALQIDENPPDVHYNLANSYFLLGKTTTLIPYYQKAIDLNPDKSESHYNLGNAFYVLKEYDEAINSF